ncbi:MAG: nucleotidyltransferase domain-containing protein [Nitrososphaerota archaeon]|nr:nucleotidyltransferase domain-containing protein [Nitrososphaerota archaeon]
MGRSIPNWLVSKYFTLFLYFSLLPFKTEEAKSVLGSSKTPLLLHKMYSYGWVDKVERGVYRIVHPLIAIMEASGFSWRSKIKETERLLLLEAIVAKIFEVLGPKLESIVLFGSLAVGRVKPESDIDLLVVARDLPHKYGDRVSIIREIVSSSSIDEIIIRMWKEKGIYSEIHMLLIDVKEAGLTHPFYLDLVKDSVIIYDRNNLMTKKITEVKEKLEEIGAKRFEEPNGSWYWILSPSAEAARSLEL